MSSAPLLDRSGSASSSSGGIGVRKHLDDLGSGRRPCPTRESLEGATIGAGKVEYYRRQHEMQQALREVDQLLSEEAQRRSDGQRSDGRQAAEAVAEREEEQGTGSRTDKLAVSLSNYVNVVLFVLKLYASVATRSLAIIASTLDSLLDILAGGILWYTATAMEQHDPARYPVGKRRMQPVGIIIFAAVMATLGFQVLLQGVSSLLSGPSSAAEQPVSPVVLHWVLLLLCGVIAVKLALFLLCRSSASDIVQAYATDHFLDVITNAVSLFSALLASQAAWWVDPCGAIVIALYTIANWSRTVMENAESLIGASASPEFLAKIIHITLHHDLRVRRIESIRAWQLGSKYIVEVDIELPGEMNLREAHDIGETLQNKLEALPEVDRAFVHLDHDDVHLPEHAGGSLHASTEYAQAAQVAQALP